MLLALCQRILRPDPCLRTSASRQVLLRPQRTWQAPRAPSPGTRRRPRERPGPSRCFPSGAGPVPLEAALGGARSPAPPRPCRRLGNARRARAGAAGFKRANKGRGRERGRGQQRPMGAADTGRCGWCWRFQTPPSSRRTVTGPTRRAQVSPAVLVPSPVSHGPLLVRCPPPWEVARPSSAARPEPPRFSRGPCGCAVPAARHLPTGMARARGLCQHPPAEPGGVRIAAEAARGRGLYRAALWRCSSLRPPANRGRWEPRARRLRCGRPRPLWAWAAGGGLPWEAAGRVGPGTGGRTGHPLREMRVGRLLSPEAACRIGSPSRMS